MRVVYKLWKDDHVIYVGSGVLDQPAQSQLNYLADRYEVIAIVPDGDKELTRMFETAAWMYHSQKGCELLNTNAPHASMLEYHKWLAKSEDVKNGAAQGGVWWSSLTPEEKEAHKQRMREGRERSTKKVGRPKKREE